ncbi:unnamed protein product [Miscanthus lutarioriparius]|uniref:Mitogen-activated protein kinase n=1 Tax=Miscanthus lutarioriparius TaxID=422564 RepID=A0A811PXV5_9POAL|nr:unnamed protein product [Miscanthus lutarioriparius]
MAHWPWPSSTESAGASASTSGVPVRSRAAAPRDPTGSRIRVSKLREMALPPQDAQPNKIRSDKAREYLLAMPRKRPIPFSHKFHNADPLALCLLEHLLAFDPKDRPTAEEALADPYFSGLCKLELEPSAQPISKVDFEFEGRKLTKAGVREMIYREILEYHPQMLQEYIEGGEQIHFLYPRERVCSSEDGHNQDSDNEEQRAASYVARTTISPPRSQEEGRKLQSTDQSATNTANSCAKSYLKSAPNISASRRAIKGNTGRKEDYCFVLPEKLTVSLSGEGISEAVKEEEAPAGS